MPFLLPQDGYVAEQLRDVPEGLARYLLSLQDKRVLQSVQILNSQVNHLNLSSLPPIRSPAKYRHEEMHNIAYQLGIESHNFVSNSTTTSSVCVFLKICHPMTCIHLKPIQNGAPKTCIAQQPTQTNGASTNGTNGNGQTTVLMPASIPQTPLIRSASQSTLTSLPTPFVCFSLNYVIFKYFEKLLS